MLNAKHKIYFNGLKSGPFKMADMNIGTRITKARSDAGLSKSQLARAVGVTPSSVTQWESGETKTIEGGNLAKIAVACGVDAVWLATGKGNKSSTHNAGSNVRAVAHNRPVPVLSWVQAGHMRDIDHVPDPQLGEWPVIEPQFKVGIRAWALLVEGDSMDDGTEKGIPAGWIIVVDPDKAPSPNSYVIAKDTATQQATFKRLVTDGGRWYLKPLNPQYPMVEIDDPALRVIGVVTEARPPSRKLA